MKSRSLLLRKAVVALFFVSVVDIFDRKLEVLLVMLVNGKTVLITPWYFIILYRIAES